MDNPWKNLKQANNEYIADGDRSMINDYFKNSLKGKYSLKLNILPGPYTGDPKKAVVYLLALNPGYDDNDILVSQKHEGLLMDNLLHKIEDYPFMALNPLFEGTTGQQWWQSKLYYLIEKIGLQACSKLIFNVEYFPYHSEKYKPIKKILPSQEYSFSLVREAMNNKKIIIIMRSEKLWHEAIPELKNYSYKYLLHSFLNVVVSPNNLGKSEFEVVINRLTEAASQKP